MIKFVNAKINLGLNIVGRRPDGYHLLETIFYPVGLYAGTPGNPEPFCDILELTKSDVAEEDDLAETLVSYEFTGNKIDCPLEKNLAHKGVEAILEWAENIHPDSRKLFGNRILRLEKHLPDGAGMGGGSADAVIAMKLVAENLKQLNLPTPDDDQMREIAVKLGADCPVFVDNRPAYAEGIGERLQLLDEFLKGKWLAVVKPELRISTKEAFAGVTPRPSSESLLSLIRRPINEWKNRIHNDFEDSLFPRYPELQLLKEELYKNGAEYASMTGSGAALYGIFATPDAGSKALENINVTYKALLLL